MTKNCSVSLSILGKEYKVSCTTEEKDNLTHSAQRLDNKMREIRDSGKVTNAERVAVMAALNLVHDIDPTTIENPQLNLEIDRQLLRLQKKIDNTLEKV
ncbi:MAG: cell division protein ZapA [Methylococcales bacterium]|jgi:cell division protein ZapA|nr:cell division protein ZapA [Methylococcales bacterium]